MKPCAPTIVGPISTLSKFVRVQGTLAGASVEVNADGVAGAVAQGTAHGPDQYYPIVNQLQAGQVLRARQTSQLVTSDRTPDPHAITVLGGPKKLPVPNLYSHLYRCSQCVWVDGIYPGADLEVMSGNTLRASDPGVLEVGARVVFVPAISAAEKLVAVQRSAFPPNVSPLAAFPSPDPPSRPDDLGNLRPIDAPWVDGDLYECQASIPVAGVIDGAVVTVSIYDVLGSDTPRRQESRCVDIPDAWFPLAQALNKGEYVRVSQGLAGQCQLDSPKSQSWPVLPDRPPAPVLPDPLCEGDTAVRVSNLIPPAEVTFYDAGEIPIAKAMAWAGEGLFALPDGALANAGGSLRVTQTLCGRESLDGDRAIDKARPHTTPVIAGSPFECALAVRVLDVAAGDYVEILSSALGGINPAPIGSAIATRERVDVLLCLPLLYPDTIVARVYRCGQALLSPSVLVQPLRLDILPPPTLPSTTPDTIALIVTGHVPGSRLDVYVRPSGEVNEQFQWSETTSVSPWWVTLPPSVRIGDTLRVRQRICGKTSPLSTTCKVVAGTVALIPGSVDRIRQLAGAKDGPALDPKYKAQERPFIPTNTAPTEIAGTDLGISVEFKGRAYFLFGDTDFAAGATGLNSVAYTSDVRGASMGPLTWVTRAQGNVVTNDLAVPAEPPSSYFEVPTGAFAYSGRVYVFLSRNFVAGDYQSGTEMWSSYMASGSDLTHPTLNLEHKLIDVVKAKGPQAWASLRGFAYFINVSPTVIKNSWYPYPLLPLTNATDGLLLFGSGPYRWSDVFVAWAPLTQGQPPPPSSQWFFLTGVTNGMPEWSGPGEMSKSLGIHELRARGLNQPFDAATQLHADNGGVGEFSVSWVPGLRRWILLKGGVAALVAPVPWGPWESVQPGDGFAKGTALQSLITAYPWGANPAYGNYIVNRFTEWSVDDGAATIYFVTSFNSKGTGKPEHYAPHLMVVRVRGQ